MRDTTLTSPEMHMERVAAYEISCLLGKYNWPKIFYLFYFIIIYFILFYFILFFYYYYFILLLLLLLLLFYWSFIFLSLKHVYDLNCTLKLLPGTIVEFYFFFTYKPVTKVGVIFWPGEFETQTKYSGQFVLPRKWTVEKDWRNQWVKKPV